MIIQEGQLRGSFKGFKNRDTLFEFRGNAGIWRQKEYKYLYHYAYMPYAKVVQRNGGYYLEVEGMDDSVEVVKVR
ncbi:hypothetical protein Q9Q94_10255 [Uliginosibacterium sp. 31-16]|uniref:hypothetical protein n=1 Tax=Uliginosibacterium sp. 31-16 TaxID=3068315 RepID=UPI00273EE0A0|nr:hypothetical protein [Uliginosibacterium sp. 31-16]MDP5239917.1 hypothetical protein [Uliginosibacterium sp. 31-16]